MTMLFCGQVWFLTACRAVAEMEYRRRMREQPGLWRLVEVGS